jgi:hypothetical protein
VLDALVRTRADVLPEQVAPFLGTCTSTALVLLAEDAERSAGALLAFFESCGREATGVEWLAAGGLLLRERSEGFTHALVEDLHLDLEVRVVDDGRFFGKDIETACGEGFLVPKSFPGVATYVMREGRAQHGELLAGDPFPISYRRMLVRGGFVLPSSAASETPQDRARVTWLEVLAGMAAGAMEIETETSLRIEWKDAQDFERRAAQAREAIETRWRGLRGELLRHRLLERGSALGASPFVRVTVRDERKSPDPPLPEIPGAVVQERRR